MGTGNLDYWRWGEDLVPSNRPVRSGNDQSDLVPTFHQLLEGGHGKIRGPEEDDFHPRSVQQVSVSIRPVPVSVSVPDGMKMLDAG